MFFTVKGPQELVQLLCLQMEAGPGNVGRGYAVDDIYGLKSMSRWGP